jgi:hypothetical protein
MATVTQAEENITSSPLTRTFKVALAPADANKLALTVDLRDYARVEFQYVGTLPAGNIGFTGGLTADNLVVNNIRVIRYANMAAGNVVDTGDIFGAGRQMPSSSIPAFIGIVPSSTFTGTGTLYVRVSK